MLLLSTLCEATELRDQKKNAQGIRRKFPEMLRYVPMRVNAYVWNVSAIESVRSDRQKILNDF
jgi:hypothetical protein